MKIGRQRRHRGALLLVLTNCRVVCAARPYLINTLANSSFSQRPSVGQQDSLSPWLTTASDRFFAISQDLHLHPQLNRLELCIKVIPLASRANRAAQRV